MAEIEQPSFSMALANAAAAAINAQSASLPTGTVAAVADEPVLGLESLPPTDPPIIQVIPHADDEERKGGGGLQAPWTGTYKLSVIVCRGLDVPSSVNRSAQFAVMMGVRQVVRDAFKRVELPVAWPFATRAVLTSIGGLPAYEHERLKNLQLFISETVLTFEMVV